MALDAPGNTSAANKFIHGDGLLDVAVEVFTGIILGYEPLAGELLTCTYTTSKSRRFEISLGLGGKTKMPTCFYKV